MNEDKIEAHNILRKIYNSWRTGYLEKIRYYLHLQIVMKFPGISGEIINREALIDSFNKFYNNAKVIEYTESDEQINVIRNCAIITFCFGMIYEKTKLRYKSTG
jgi:hypothetical protein